jgi:hypothetical protein
MHSGKEENEMFYGDFKNKSDVCEEFAIPDFEGVIVFACYDRPPYEGYAEVIYLHEGKFFMAQGSHCSCYGLEDSWAPIEMPIEGLRRILSGTGMLSQYYGHLSEVLDLITELNLEGADPDIIQVALTLAIG